MQDHVTVPRAAGALDRPGPPASFPPGPLVTASGIGKRFRRNIVLESVTLDVKAGEALALLGPNGAGKTTLLRILATLARPSHGTALIAGHDVVSDPEDVRRHIGLLAHGAHVYDDLSALENLKFWTMLTGASMPPDVLRSALAAVELDAYADDRVRVFSAGMKRRLGLARLILGAPRVLLLDEPFAGLDQRGRKWLDEYLRTFKESGGAILMVTHGFGRDLNVVDRVAILSGGRIVLDAPRVSLPADEIARLYALHTEDGA